MGFDIGGAAALTSSSGTLSLDATSFNWMKVNPNGILTRPKNPFMRGQITGKGTPYNGGGGNLLITADADNTGSWNNSTGVWTSPVPGYYMVTAGNIANAQAGYLNIMKNGVTEVFTHWNHTNSWHYISLSAVVVCAALDTITFRITSLTPGSNGFYGDGGHNMYSIALLV